MVQDPAVIFDCAESRHLEEDYAVAFTLDDLAEKITSIRISYEVNERTAIVNEYEASPDGKAYSFVIPAADIDFNERPDRFKLIVEVENSYRITYKGEKEGVILDEPFIGELRPAPNAQTGEEKRPLISAKVGNAGDAPKFAMKVNDADVDNADLVFENGVLSYTPKEELNDGRTSVRIEVTRADGKTAEKTWSFVVGDSEYQLYFGQLHSHTTYSDGSGSLDTALDYIASFPASANVDFVAFTDHSNYFDTTSAANPADAMNDISLMTPASRELWEGYKGKVAAFNAKQSDVVAIAGYEMTWSGGPGHINSYNTSGLVSRNNAELNNKSSDAGMRLYYATMNKDNGETLHQFNHPGTTFGNFTDFSYWDEETDKRMFLVEVGNGEGQIGQGGYYPSYEEYILALDKGWHVAPTNNQDNHKGRWGNANDARDVVLANDFSEEGIYDAIRAMRVYATEDKNLQLYYTINDMPMGTIFTEEETPEKLDILLTLFDPDNSDSVSKAEVVSDGGKVVYTWDDAEQIGTGELRAQIDPDYSYYFIRVIQEDGDLAVTAPIWAGQPLEVGISSFASASEKVYANEETTLSVTLFNNEESDVKVKSLTYTVNGSTVIGTDTKGYDLEAGSELTVDMTHTFEKAKLTTVTVTAVIDADDKEMIYKADLELDVLDRNEEDVVSSIRDVRDASDEDDTGYRFIIEGVVTSNASGHDKDTAFFDCIYVQDESGGICVFPVSGDFKVGDKVKIVGHTDFYQGEPELQVESIELISEGNDVVPKTVSAKEINDRDAEGLLVNVNGVIESYEIANGLVQTIMVKDANGDVVRVFVDGYITTLKDVENLEVGNKITVIGLASYDDTFNAPEGPFPRIRIRDRKDIVCETSKVDYHIIQGNDEVVMKNADGTWAKGYGSDLLVVSDAPFDKFRDVYIDEEKVSAGSYDAQNGSTRISLHSDYLATLSEGRHKIEIRSADGSAFTTVTIRTLKDVQPSKPDSKPVYVIPITGVEE